MMGIGDISAWPGEPDKKVLLSLAKLAEECNELAGICARIIAQGIDECEPETKVPNREALMKELSDVRAISNFASEQTGVFLDGKRVSRKYNGYYRWFDMLKDKGVL